MSAPELEPRARRPLSSRLPSDRQLKPAGFEYEACRLVLLETAELTEVPRDRLEAMLEGDGREIGAAELHRHRTVRERWHHARMWRGVHGQR